MLLVLFHMAELMPYPSFVCQQIAVCSAMQVNRMADHNGNSFCTQFCRGHARQPGTFPDADRPSRLYMSGYIIRYF